MCEKFHVSKPIQVIDLLALQGDASDNIPGCPGVGEKTAAKLIAEYGSVENIIAHAGEIKGVLGRRVAENAEKIVFSKFLATIKTDVPTLDDLELSSLILREPDIAELTAIYEELEFAPSCGGSTPEPQPRPLLRSSLQLQLPMVWGASSTSSPTQWLPLPLLCHCLVGSRSGRGVQAKP